MPEIVLKTPSVHSARRQCASSRMPEHMDVDRKRQTSGFSSALNHPADSHATEWLITLVDKDVGRTGAVLRLLASQQLEPVELVTFEVMDAVGAALQPAGHDRPRG